jgi:serine/threonine-protein kinase
VSRAIGWDDIELLDALGEGQSGSVWRGRLKRPVGEYPAGAIVAVKRYKPWVLHERGQIARIFAEVETGRRIVHRNVMRVLGAVMDDSGRPALVMQYYDGPTLESLLREMRARDTPLPVETSFAYLRDLASGIRALHAGGIIHRDIKPANVIVHSEGLVVADFGVVRSQDLPEQTTTGAFLGTIRYAAPEYLFGRDYNDRIDIYSLGAIAYELFSNREVFRGREALGSGNCDARRGRAAAGTRGT